MSSADITTSCAYPLYAVRVADFLALERMLPHQEMKSRALVVPLDMEGEHKSARVHFISHQWLGFEVADPHGVHLRTMQDVFRRAIAGESLFTTDEDWHAYSKGLTAHASRTSALSNILEAGRERQTFARADFVHAIEFGWVRIDYVCIPQVYDGLHTETEICQERQDQSKSINSIVLHKQLLQLLGVGAFRRRTRRHRWSSNKLLQLVWPRLVPLGGDGVRPLLVSGRLPLPNPCDSARR
jgi:hypothetical protein